MALPQLHTIFPATLCRNRSHTVSPVVTRGLAQRNTREDPEQMRTLADQAVKEQDTELGTRLYGRNPDLCCYLRKVEPLERALTNYDAWITGVRRDETSNRRQTKVVEWDDRREMVKVNPIVSWSQKQVDDFITEQGVLVNPLVYDGYPSIGCATCTIRVEAGADPRSGRWAGTGKTECGIHV